MHTRSAWPRLRRGSSSVSLALLAALTLWSATVVAQRGGNGNNAIASLRGVTPPRPNVAGRYVTDTRMLVVLGKALFWDAQVGSDGRTACATCHFHAGADHRITNSVASPASAATAFRPNATLTAADFPFHAFANTNDNRSTAVRNRRDVVGSAGLVARRFVDVAPGSATDDGADPSAPGPFAIGDVMVRQVTARNAPSVINAVFNVRGFWDGRASSVFTGVTPFGDADRRANVLLDRGGSVQPEAVRLENASLASQAVGPPLNAVEMSFDGRAWARLGAKMLALPPLARQEVSGADSVLGAFANPDGRGLRPEFAYDALIRQAFAPLYWASAVVVDVNGRAVEGAESPQSRDEFSQMAYNFPLFFALAIDAYEATLVADDSRVDRFLAGDTGALSNLESSGLNEFRTGGSQCTQCHQGAELSAAGVTTARNTLSTPRDAGFFRTGVSAIGDDVGAAGSDGFGQPLFVGAPGDTAQGAFKSPGLRGVELTGPYFHSGSAATLEQVMEFYARNGDVPDGGNLGPGMGNIRLSGQERTEIVAFLKALTDDRVRFERAPFDHPSLCVPVGHVESAGVLQRDGTSSGTSAALDLFALVAAVGAGGNGVPLQTFEELLAGIGRDGSRAHVMTTACTP